MEGKILLTEEKVKRLDLAMKTLESEGKLDPFIFEFIFDALRHFDEIVRYLQDRDIKVTFDILALKKSLEEVRRSRWSYLFSSKDEE